MARLDLSDMEDFKPKQEERQSAVSSMLRVPTRKQTRCQSQTDMTSSVNMSYEAFRQKYLKKGNTTQKSLERTINIGGTHAQQENNRFSFPFNQVSTTKYEWWSIVPKNLMEQFRRTANIWFLVVSILQLAPLDLSPTTPTATLVPLCCVLFVTFCKDAFEDYRRARDDRRLNNQRCAVLDGEGQFRTACWKDLTVGVYVRLERDEPIPCDMILLACSGDDGVAFVDTAQLDGETSLKPKYPVEETMRICSPEELVALEGTVKTEPPNQLLQSFSGMLVLRGHPRSAPVDAKSFLLRGSTLRNTAWAFGLTIFTGHDTKLVQNLKKAPSKRSRVEVTSNYLLLIVFGLLVLASLISTVTQAIYLANGTVGAMQRQWVWPDSDPLRDSSYLAMVTFMILYNNLIPISLYVTADLVRAIQGFMMERDQSMYHAETESFCTVRSSSLNENLGQVEFVLTDKTGTLTENHMQFKAASIGGRIYGFWDENKGPVEHVAATPPPSVCLPLEHRLFAHAFSSKATPDFSPTCSADEVQDQIADFFLCLATCHAAIVEQVPLPKRRPSCASMDGTMRSSGTNSLSTGAGDHTPRGNPSAPSPREPCARGAKLPAERKETPNNTVLSGESMKSPSATPRHDSRPSQHPDPLLVAEAMQMTYRSASPDEEALVAAARDFGFFFRKKVASRFTVNVNGEDQHYVCLIFNDFTSDRKRMSILVRRVQDRPSLEQLPSECDPCGPDSPTASARLTGSGELQAGDDTPTEQFPAVLYAKGADNVMLERLSERGSRQKGSEAFRRHLNNFTSKGLRTLVLAKRYLKEEEVRDFSKRMEEAKGAFMNREAMMESVADDMEQEFELLGLTAIEDRIQHGVPETVSLLQRAGIKVWMLTGDNMETAVNIGISCQLIENTMKTYRVDLPGAEAQDRDAVRDKLESLYTSIRRLLRSQQRAGDFRYCVIVHGRILYTIMDDPCLRQLLLAIACSASSVVACRLAPAQKAQIVKLVRGGLQGDPLTLAIGDGGNDVAMIQEAHVGVGILGTEGRQAANAADFTIGQFRFLQRLLFVHGRWNLRRISMVMGYFFYKNFLLVLPMMFYGHSSGFSGTTLYESYLLAIFNLVFTSLPIMIAGVLDWDISPRVALLVPSLYQLGPQGHYFNPRVLLGWIFRGALHAVLISVCMLGVFGGSLATDTAGGLNPDLFVMGSWAYGACVVVANATIMLHTKSWMDWQILVTLLSSLVFLPAMAVYSQSTLFLSLLEPNMAGVASSLFLHLRCWLAMLLVAAASLLSDVAVKLTRRALWPCVDDTLREVQLRHLPDAGAVCGNDRPCAVDADSMECSEEAPQCQENEIEERLRCIPAAPTRVLQLKPDGRSSLKPMIADTKGGGWLRRGRSRKVGTSPYFEDTNDDDLWDDVPESLTQRTRLKISRKAAKFFQRQWRELQISELAGSLSYDKIEMPLRSEASGETDVTEGALSPKQAPTPRVGKHLKKALSSATFSRAGSSDSLMSLDETSPYGDDGPAHRTSFMSNGSNETQGSVQSGISGAAGRVSSGLLGIGGPLYSLITLRFNSYVQEAAFKTFLEQRAIPLFRFFCLTLALYCVLYNFIQFVLQPTEIYWAVFLVLSAMSMGIPLVCLSPRIRLPCGGLCGLSFRRGFEWIIVILLMLLLACKHLYDHATLNSGILFNTYTPMFIVAFARVRFTFFVLITCYHLTLIVTVYLFLGETGILPEFKIGMEYFVLMLGTMSLTVYYAYQHEVLMRKDFFLLDSIAHSRHEGLVILKGMFPEEVVNHVLFKIGSDRVSRMSQQLLKDRVASVLFLDIMEFDDLVETLRPDDLVQLLDQVWSLLDRLCDRHRVAKIETVGKTYMAAALPDDPTTAPENQQAADALRAVTTAIFMLQERARRFIGHGKDGKATQVNVKIGVNTGRVLSGVVGTLKPQFALFGDTVNTASRMCSTGARNCVHVSGSTWELIKHDSRLEWEARKTQAKGKGLMDTYLLKRAHGLQPEKKRSTTPTIASTEYKVSSRRGSMSSLFSQPLSLMPPMRPSVVSSSPNAAANANSNPSPKNDAEQSPVNEEDDEDDAAGAEVAPAEYMELPSLARGRSMWKSDDGQSRVRKYWRHAIGLFRYFFCSRLEGGQLGSSMMSQWLSYLGFLAWFAAESLVLAGRSSTSIEECVLRLGYVCIGATASVLLWAYGRANYWGAASQQSISATTVPSIFSAVVALAVFIGFVCSAIANQVMRSRLSEDDEEDGNFFAIFEAFFFAVVLMQLSRLHPGGMVPSSLNTAVCIYTVTYAAVWKRENLLECISYFLILSGSHAMALWTDPRTGFDEYNRICEEHEQIQELVDSMLPREVLSEMKLNKLSLAYKYEDMTFLFADIVGFTRYCASHTAEQAVNLVTQLFAHFDDEAKLKGVYKVCTIGDAYVVVNEPRRKRLRAQLRSSDESGSTTPHWSWKGMPVFEMGRAMLNIIKMVRESEEVRHLDLDMRIGVHFGRFVGGVIGTKRLRFDIWGQDVLVGNNVESHGKAGEICVSEPAKQVLERAGQGGLDAAMGLRFEFNDDIVLKCGRSVRTYICYDSDSPAPGCSTEDAPLLAERPASLPLTVDPPGNLPMAMPEEPAGDERPLTSRSLVTVQPAPQPAPDDLPGGAPQDAPIDAGGGADDPEPHGGAAGAEEPVQADLPRALD